MEFLVGSTSSARKSTPEVLSLRGPMAISIRYSRSISLSGSVASPNVQRDEIRHLRAACLDDSAGAGDGGEGRT